MFPVIDLYSILRYIIKGQLYVMQTSANYKTVLRLDQLNAALLYKTFHSYIEYSEGSWKGNWSVHKGSVSKLLQEMLWTLSETPHTFSENFLNSCHQADGTTTSKAQSRDCYTSFCLKLLKWSASFTRYFFIDWCFFSFSVCFCNNLKLYHI